MSKSVGEIYHLASLLAKRRRLDKWCLFSSIWLLQSTFFFMTKPPRLFRKSTGPISKHGNVYLSQIVVPAALFRVYTCSAISVASVVLKSYKCRNEEYSGGYRDLEQRLSRGQGCTYYYKNSLKFNSHYHHSNRHNK